MSAQNKYPKKPWTPGPRDLLCLCGRLWRVPESATIGKLYTCQHCKRQSEIMEPLNGLLRARIVTRR